MLLTRIGLKGGMKIREAGLGEMLLPALLAVFLGCAIVLLGRVGVEEAVVTPTAI